MSFPIYNFKRIDDLFSYKLKMRNNENNYLRTNSQNSFNGIKNISFYNLNHNNISYQSRSLIRSNSKSSNVSLKKLNRTVSMKNYDNIKMMENFINKIKEDGFEKNKKEIENKIIKRNKILKNIKILESYNKLNRISKNNFNNLSKRMNIENERLKFFSNKANNETFNYNILIPKLKKEIYEIKKEIEIKKKEIKNSNKEKRINEKDLKELNEEIKKYNRLNNEVFNQKDNIKNTLDLFKNHINLQKEKLNFQINKINKLMESASYLAKKTKF